MSMPNCIIYARVNQRAIPRTENSIRGQIKKCKNFARRNKLKIIGEFTDVASGVTSPLEREGLGNALCAMGTQDFLLVTSEDRISRRLSDCFEVHQEMLKGECRLISVKDDSKDIPTEFRLLRVLNDVCGKTRK